MLEEVDLEPKKMVGIWETASVAWEMDYCVLEVAAKAALMPLGQDFHHKCGIGEGRKLFPIALAGILGRPSELRIGRVGNTGSSVISSTTWREIRLFSTA